METYSAFRLLREAARRHTGWQPAWHPKAPDSRYDVVIIGGGGHGLATAYYLAKNHGVTNVAVLERGWIGGGNTGRNTTVIRSNYYYPESVALYDLALSLYEGLGKELNYNVMFSQRGMITLGHSRQQVDSMRRWVGSMRANGVDSELIDRAEIARRLPALDVSGGARFPVWGGFIQKRGGTARHDAVAWGYARAADRLGVDIIQNCEVQGFGQAGSGRVTSVRTSLGDIHCDAAALCVAGHTSQLAALAGVRLPISSMALQAFVSEPIKPVINTVALSMATGVYVSQSDKGGLVIGGALDLYNSYAQRGNQALGKAVLGGFADQYPSLGRVRLLRQWAGIVDIVPDSSPILGETTVPGLYVNAGWGTGGFKAIPAGGTLLAHHLATGAPHPIARPFGFDRFARGALIDEAAGSGIAH